MTKDINFIFLDIDGTIFEHQRLIPSAVEAVQALQKRNMPIALCTGRSVLHTRKIQEHLNIDYGVYFNGGLAKSGEHIVYATPLERDVVKRILALSGEHDLPIVLHTDEDAVVLRDMPAEFQPILDSFDFPPLKRVNVEWIMEQDVFQVNMMMDRSVEQLVQNALPEVLIYRWNDRAVDLQKRDCDKSIGAAALLDHLRLDARNALHIGDGGNDIGMFKTVGFSFAMGNATDEVKKFAKMTTCRAEHGGVLEAFRTIGLFD